MSLRDATKSGVHKLDISNHGCVSVESGDPLIWPFEIKIGTQLDASTVVTLKF